MTPRILIDAREFIPHQLTGIGRFLDGLIDALSREANLKEFTLAVTNSYIIPERLKKLPSVNLVTIPNSFIASENALSTLSNHNYALFISPYPKLPLFGCSCTAVHTIHDVLDLTQPFYKKRVRVFFDRIRLKKALKRAELTWFVSSWSMKKTKELVGFVGINPHVRHNGIDARFSRKKDISDEKQRSKYGLDQDYILVIGNGKPHKNIGILLDISSVVKHQIVFIGVSAKRKQHWVIKYPNARAKWIEIVADDDLPAVIRGAFCLAHPSTEEGYGYPPLEAMASGIPTVVSNIPVLVETTGGSALTADPNNPRKWIEEINTLENNTTHQCQVEKGLNWVKPLRGRKAWNSHITDIEELLGKN